MFHADALNEALKLAPAVADLVGRPDKSSRLRLTDAFAEATDHSKRGKKARKDWDSALRRFAARLQEHHPHMRYWEYLDRPLPRGYSDALVNKSPNYRRLRMQPIVLTDRWLSRERGYARSAEGVASDNRPLAPPPRVYLRDVVEFCDWVAARAPRLEAGVALQGLAGLRLQEAHRLTWDRADLKRRLVEVSGEVKNEW